MSFIVVSKAIEIFEGITFDLAKMRAIMPDGTALTRAQFNIVFGGHVWALDLQNERTTRQAWVAYTANQGFRPVFK